MFAAEIRKRRVVHHSYSQWRWHLDEVFVRINTRHPLPDKHFNLTQFCDEFFPTMSLDSHNLILL
jgi:hypothetical protein